MTINTDDVDLNCQRNEQLQSFLCEKEERLNLSKITGGAVSMKRKSNTAVIFANMEQY